MDQASTMLPGISKEELDTPAFLIDLDIMEENIRKMAEYFADRPVDVRPHMKHHKTPAIAHKQLQAGAIGVCCQKLGEAEVMAASGIRDILITYEVVGHSKIRRLMALCRHADMMLTMDDAENVRELSEAAQAFSAPLRILVDVDCGHHRCGVEPGEATAQLARVVAKAPGLSFWKCAAMQATSRASRTRKNRP